MDASHLVHHLVEDGVDLLDHLVIRGHLDLLPSLLRELTQNLFLQPSDHETLAKKIMQLLCAGVPRVVHCIGRLFRVAIPIRIGLKRAYQVRSYHSHQVVNLDWATEHGCATDQYAPLCLHQNGYQILRALRVPALQVVRLVGDTGLEVALFYLFKASLGQVIGKDKDAGVGAPLVLPFLKELDVFIPVDGGDPLAYLVLPSVAEGGGGNNQQWPVTFIEIGN